MSCAAHTALTLQINRSLAACQSATPELAHTNKASHARPTEPPRPVCCRQLPLPGSTRDNQHTAIQRTAICASLHRSRQHCVALGCSTPLQHVIHNAMQPRPTSGGPPTASAAAAALYVTATKRCCSLLSPLHLPSTCSTAVSCAWLSPRRYTHHGQEGLCGMGKGAAGRQRLQQGRGG